MKILYNIYRSDNKKLFKTAHRRLNRCYKHRLNQLHKKAIEDSSYGLKYLITRLQWIRDQQIIKSGETGAELSQNLPLLSLITALDERMALDTCAVTSTQGGAATNIETSSTFQDEYMQHYNIFWKLFCFWVEDWEALC